MTIIDLNKITNPQAHPNVLLQQNALPDLTGLKLNAENCLNEKVTVSIPVEKPEHSEKPEKPGHHPIHGKDEFQHQEPPMHTGIYDFPAKQPNKQPQPQKPNHPTQPKPQESVSLTFIKPLTLNPGSAIQLPNNQSIPAGVTDANGSAWLVQPDDTIQQVNMQQLLNSLLKK